VKRKPHQIISEYAIDELPMDVVCDTFHDVVTKLQSKIEALEEHNGIMLRSLVEISESDFQDHTEAAKAIGVATGTLRFLGGERAE
jgi:hypothetical protein